MENEHVKEIIEILLEAERPDLCDLLSTHFKELLDEDYIPPKYVKEPKEEYDTDTGEEEEVEIVFTPDGHCHIK